MTTEDIDERILLAREQTFLAQERSYLADLRTFQSWIRTGLAAVGGGLALMRLLIFQSFTHQLLSQISGGILVLLGILIFILSYIDYRNSCKTFYIHPGYAGSLYFCCLISVVLVLVSILLLSIAFKIDV